jgi:hypothetical protein
VAATPGSSASGSRSGARSARGSGVTIGAARLKASARFTQAAFTAGRSVRCTACDPLPAEGVARERQALWPCAG